MTEIHILDIGTGSQYHLIGSRLEMVVDGGCCDALNDNGCQVDEAMPDDEIVRHVRKAWLIGYDGDPVANNLKIWVCRRRENKPAY
jgi:hypothetical protein